MAGVVGLLAGCLAPSGDTEATDDSAANGFEMDGDFELPTDPQAGDFSDRTGLEVVEITTRMRESEPQFVFDPPFVRLDVGATVRWVNGDGVFHTVTSTERLDDRTGGGDTFDEQLAGEGVSFEWSVESRGRQHYYCSPHAGFMFGSIDAR